MTEAHKQASRGRFAIRRILAAFGPATMSAGVFEGTVALAGTALLEWTGLPFIRPISLHGLAATSVSQPELELQFRALAAEGWRPLHANSSAGHSGSHGAGFPAR